MELILENTGNQLEGRPLLGEGALEGDLFFQENGEKKPKGDLKVPTYFFFKKMVKKKGEIKKSQLYLESL